MSDKLFRRILWGVTLLGVLSVIALVIRTYLLAQDCSIISYIANGR